MPDNYSIIRQAILNKQQVTADYQGYHREMCPHALGTNKLGRRQGLFYQFGGTSSSGLQPDGSAANWRCIAIDELQNVSTRPGAWHTAFDHSKRQTCVAVVDVEVSY